MSLSGAEPLMPVGAAALPVATPIMQPSAVAKPQASKTPAATTEALAGDANDQATTTHHEVDLLAAAPAWLISAIVHMVLMIVLGLLFVSPQDARDFVLSLSTIDSGGEDFDLGDVEAPITLDEPVLEPSDALQPMQIASVDPTTEIAGGPPSIAELGIIEAADKPAIEVSLIGRQEGMKQTLGRAYGNTTATETAVTEALRWLARNQMSNGYWSLRGKYADGANQENPEAATAMALLAFQGAGFTPDGDRKHPFTPVVAKGWNALLKSQDEEGNFFREGSGNGRLYTHALCTIALCELYGMTKDSNHRDAAQAAVDYCVDIQAAEGGWRYEPKVDSDLSVTGWFVMALQSARMAGLDVPSPTLGRIGDFLETVSIDDGAQYAYAVGQGPKISMTAEGLLCRQYLGWKQSDERLQRGVAEILKQLPSADSGRTHVYYWYYAAQVCHHMEGSSWRTWNEAMREAVPALQVREGKERGSWDPGRDETTGVGGGGRLFVTCLATYMLEVYYRHLPIYQLQAISGGESTAQSRGSTGF